MVINYNRKSPSPGMCGCDVWGERLYKTWLIIYNIIFIILKVVTPILFKFSNKPNHCPNLYPSYRKVLNSTKYISVYIRVSDSTHRHENCEYLKVTWKYSLWNEIFLYLAEESSSVICVEWTQIFGESAHFLWLYFASKTVISTIAFISSKNIPASSHLAFK